MPEALDLLVFQRVQVNKATPNGMVLSRRPEVVDDYFDLFVTFLYIGGDFLVSNWILLILDDISLENVFFVDLDYNKRVALAPLHQLSRQVPGLFNFEVQN